jgi:hypothetical protein
MTVVQLKCTFHWQLAALSTMQTFWHDDTSCFTASEEQLISRNGWLSPELDDFALSIEQQVETDTLAT